MTPRQRRFAIFAAINIALVVGGWMMLISPQRSSASAASAQEVLVQNQLAALTGTQTTTPVKQPDVHTADIYKLGTALPSQLDMPDLLLELDRLASGSGVTIISLSPQTPTAGAGTYTSQSINLSLSGTYFQITGFLKSLRLTVSDQGGHLVANGPLFAVTSVSLAPGTSDTTHKKTETATVVMAAYYYGFVGGATAPAPPTTDTTTTSTTGS